jgi:ribosome-binding factor A
MADPIKDNRAKSILTDAAASFIAVETNGLSLITVTNVNLTNHGKLADILVTVLPDKDASTAISFLKRKRGVFRDYLKAKTKLSRIPFVDFNLDLGEKNRQRIDELTLDR